MSTKSPLALVNEKFGGKDKLVDALVGLLDAGEESKDDLRKRLLGVSNTKLVRLHGVATTTKEKFGGRDQLVTAAATALGSAKDKDRVAKLESFSTSRLLDVAMVAERRKKAAEAKAKAEASKSPKTA